jgi:hypothetical protein
VSQWQILAFESPYRAAVAVQDALCRGDLDAASTGLDELIAAMGRSERRALKSQLIRLMAHVIKWKEQPSGRSRSWVQTIRHARREIQDIQEETPSLNRTAIESIWEQAFRYASGDAEVEMGQPVHLDGLTWAEVFEDTYQLEAQPG